MKISDFSERVQALYGDCKQEDDGDITLTLKEGEWFWAKITPLSFQQNTANDEAPPYQNRYEIVMRKKHTSNTRHAYLTQLRWNHKLLDKYTPWLETSESTCIRCLAKESDKEKQHG